MPPRTILAAALAVIALVACGQREGTHLVSADTATATAEAPTQDATDAPKSTAPAEPDPPEETSPTTAPTPATDTAAEEPTSTPEETPAPDRSSADAPGTSSPKSADATDPGAALWDRSFRVVSVEVAGEPRPLVDDTELFVMPFRDRDRADRNERYRGIRFHGGCNTGGASLRITAERFIVADDGAMSAAGCADPVMKQERWFVDFIHTSPRWALSADSTRLRLASDDTVLTLVEEAWPPWTTTP